MWEGTLIDDMGRAWSDRSWALARRLGHEYSTPGLSIHAVREHGFIHLRPQESCVRVGVRAGGFAPVALAAALFWLKERNPRRIILAVLSDDEWDYEMLASVWEFAERAEQLAAGGPIEVRCPWLAAERHLRTLSLPAFARIRPLMRLWEASRGRMPDDIEQRAAGFGLLDRMVLTRQRSGSSRLVFALFGAGIEFMRPCESFLMIGRDVDDVPDRDYGCRTARAYHETQIGRRPRLESIRATIRVSKTTAIKTRYDRLLLPWHGAGGERFVTGISLTRIVDRRVLNDARQIGEHCLAVHP